MLLGPNCLSTSTSDSGHGFNDLKANILVDTYVSCRWDHEDRKNLHNKVDNQQF